ncbi:MAG: hypothetical protein M3220_14785 [Chloroflexota bacterium]|nr:hypothetical protein [Chloroflexota bacterium]
MMMSRGAKLLALQEVENDLRDKIAAYKQVQKHLTVASPVRKARDAYEEAVDAEKEARTQQQSLNLEWQGVIQKADEEEKRLYSGDITNPKELEAIQMEVEQLKRRREVLEERALELIEQVDGLTQEAEEAREGYEQVEEETRQRQEALEKKEQQLKRYISHRKREREKLLEEIDPVDLDQYRYVQRLKNDTHAVATLQDGVCGACHIQVSISKRDSVERVDKSQLLTCGNCGRILVF